MRSGTGLLLFRLRRTAWRKALDQGRADLRPTAAAILQQEERDLLKFGEVGAVDNRSTVPLSDHQVRPRKDREMRGQSVLRHCQKPCEISRGNAVWFMLHEGLEGLQTCELSEGRKRQDCVFIFHISRFTDILPVVNLSLF